jgi:uncharacterized protein involved in type VI secretion and phage assembly
MYEPNEENLIVECTEFIRSRFFGKYRGIVEDNQDPEQMGRIRAKVPEVLGEEVLSGWALPCSPYAGNGEGQFMIPRREAGVWIEFEAGDLSRPIWSGCWWRRDHLPTDNEGNSAAPPLKIIRSEEGLMVTMDDSSQTINVSDQNGSNMVQIEVQENKIMIKAGTKVVVEAPQIELVENASHPVVFGDLLLQYLNQLVQLYQTHMHPGQTAMGFPVTPTTPVPPFPQAQQSLLSTKVKAG